MADWIPDEEGAFDDLANQMSAAITANPTNYALTAPQAANLASSVYGWTIALNAANAAEAAYEAAIVTKEAARAGLTGVMRADAAIIQATTAVSDANRELAGLPVHSTTRTAAPVPDTAPILMVDTSRRLEHVVSWMNSGGTKARPPGVAGLQLYVKVGGTAPGGLEDCRLLGMITRSPALEHYTAPEGGQVAYYIGQWVNTRGEAGPMSDVVAATVAALM